LNAVVLRLGLQIAEFAYPGVSDDLMFERVAGIARAAEESGFDSIWVMDHLEQITGDPNAPILEAYTLLGALAARTEHARLGSLVTAVVHRNPALLAKMITTLDVISGGRAILGIGASWNSNEQEHYGFETTSVGERLDRLEEAVQICRLMFDEETPAFEGRYYRISGAHNSPRPLGHIPILIGGSGERRTLPLVARRGDACNLFGDEETLRRKLAVLDRACEEAGRDPREVTRTALRTLVIAPTREQAQQKGEALRRSWHLDESRYRMISIEGDPDTAAERARALYDVGLDGLIVNLPDTSDLETVVLAGETLSKL
jgi:F420-dependent oxidoreductase-like protein